MPINTNEILHLLSALSDHRNLRVTVKESAKCGLMAGLGAFAGALTMGPIGAAFGGTLASITAACMTKGKFKSVSQVILEDMTPYQQNQLVDSCRRIIEDLRVEDAALVLPLLLNNQHLQQQVIANVINFVTAEMKLSILD